MAIYLDYAATTPIDKRVLGEMMRVAEQFFANPSSVHSFGQAARNVLTEARAATASFLNASEREIFFTSGGSESNNLALKGAAFALRAAKKGNHVITTQIEHASVLRSAERLEAQGFRVTYLPCDADGIVSPDAVREALTDQTILVSVMTANNEVGAIQPVAEIGAVLREKNIFFHTDATAAAGHIPLDVKKLPVDALTLSGHKLYAPKGAGVLYLARGAKIEPLIHGGGQEGGLRAGTPNTIAIAGLGAALAIAADEMSADNKKLAALQKILFAAVSDIDGAFINGPRTNRIAGNVNFGIRGIDRDTLIIRLDMAGFAVSGGSACSAGALTPSHVLVAMGKTAEAKNSVRVTLGRFTDEKEIADFVLALRSIVADIKNISKY